ncbi:MAG TPA: Type 1 glutamine amidotransferase-like domain-containing protein [Patescibacteria group bacterium]|jgi:dipeptidase E
MKSILLVSGELGAVPDFIGKAKAKVAFVPTAADLDEDKWYVERDRAFLAENGFDITEVQISRKLSAQAITVLRAADVLYVTGGNTFYLLKMFLDNGLSQVLPELVENGLKYIGASAGAVVLGPSLAPIQKLDNPSAVTLPSFDGLSLIDFVPLPHYTKGNKLYEQILQEFEKDFDLVPFTDKQAIVVSSADRRVVTSAQ